MLKHLITVAIVSGLCAGAAIACFWWAGPDARRISALVAGVCSATALEIARQQKLASQRELQNPVQSGQ